MITGHGSWHESNMQWLAGFCCWIYQVHKQAVLNLPRVCEPSFQFSHMSASSTITCPILCNCISWTALRRDTIHEKQSINPRNTINQSMRYNQSHEIQSINCISWTALRHKKHCTSLCLHCRHELHDNSQKQLYDLYKTLICMTPPRSF